MSHTPSRRDDARLIAIEIDHRPVTCPENVSVLRAAEMNGVFIPSLCSHKDLSAFGGCRLCVVEIAGMRGYPLACSTTVQDGMQVLTDTLALREMRQDILELILSEHPSSCLICDEKEACRLNVHTVRKAGVTTGCRYCPNDGQCELQTLVERLGVQSIRYPIYYRGYEAEHDDPFFDRDYNICILCGRCVRMCQEMRGTSVLAFKFRGSRTQIGPAFGRTHVEAGCEFCGACVSVCPTGALADKVSKWDGPPDGHVLSTCPFCALGCQIELHHKEGRLSKVEAALDPEINDGQLCVRGRFCLPEMTHSHERARKPMLRRGAYFRELSWTEVLDDVAAHLKDVEPDDVLMLVSPDLTNESLYTAQALMREALGSHNIDSTARHALPGGPELWAELFSLPISIADVARADAVVAVGLDSRFSFSVVGVEIRRALKRGATLVTIDARESNLARYTRHWLQPRPGREGEVLALLVAHLLGDAPPPTPAVAATADGASLDSVAAAVSAIAGAERLALVVGPTAFAVDPGAQAARALLRLGRRPKTTILPLYHGANTRGVLELGGFAEYLPGLQAASRPGLTVDALRAGAARPKVLYLVGESPFFERPSCEYLIAQDLYLPPFAVDAFLPAASFAEAEGTLLNIEGRVQRLVAVEQLPDGASTGYVRPDWFIFGELAARLGKSRPRFESASQILQEISHRVTGMPPEPDRRRRQLALDRPAVPFAGGHKLPATDDFLLVLEPSGFRHRGIDMSWVVEGLSELALEEGFRMHPDDLRELGLSNRDTVAVQVDGFTLSGPARADADCPRRTVYLYRPWSSGGLLHRQPLASAYGLGEPVRPARVMGMSGLGTPAGATSVTAGGRTQP